jgi:regulator of Ty1 transposition protein 109
MRTADGASVHVNIADLIPSLEDDPKQRFLDELALNNKPAEHELGRSEPSEKASCPMSTGQATEDNEMTSNGAATGADGASHVAATAESDNTDSATMHANEKAQTRKASAHARNAKEDEMQRRADYAALARTSYAEYWERLGFRQECAQDTTGFFSCVVGATAHRTGGTTDRSASQHSAECDTVNNTSPQTAPPRTRTPSHPSLPPTRQPKADPPNRRFQLPPTIVERLHKALLNTDFINAHLAQDGSAFWMDSMRRIVQDEIGAEGLSACMGVVRAKDREMVMKSERERDKGEKRVGEVVTVLQPRKKKRT